MTVSQSIGRTIESLGLPRVGVRQRALIIVGVIVIGTCLLRLPSFFEPPWHSDEGIFQAVAQRVVDGGRLYADAWESKPPLFLYIYVALLKLFGPGTLPLRFAATASAIGTELALLGVAMHFMSRRRALLATGILAVLLAVPFWEGDLALTETFAILPSTLAVLCLLKQQDLHDSRDGTLWLIAAGLLFSVAFLIRQTSAVVAAGLVLWLLLCGREWLRTGLTMALASAVVVTPVVLAFAVFDSWHWFWNANVGFFLSYVPSGQQLPFRFRFVIVLPVIAAIIALLFYRRRGETPRWGLPVLWLVLTLAAALLTGRPYSHYFLQIFPPLALLLALILPDVRLSWRPRREQAPALALAAFLLLLWGSVVVPAFQGNLLAMRYTKAGGYYTNFAGYALGLKDRSDYDAYFDRRVDLSESVARKLQQLHAEGKKVYIWGEYPWVYPLADATPADRYMTSFYVLLIPYLDMQLGDTLRRADPDYIVVMADVWPEAHDTTGALTRRYRNGTRAVNGLIAERYVQVANLGRAQIFQRTQERPLVTASAAPHDSP